MGHGINYMAKNFVTCALNRKLLRQARMDDTMCIQNYVNKPTRKR